MSEIPSGRLRAKSIVLARLAYNLTGLVTNTITPRALNADAWNWGAKVGYLYLGICALFTVYFFFCLPETRNRSFGEIELLFENKIGARKFSSTVVDQFSFDPHAHNPNVLRKTGSIATSHGDTITSEKDSKVVDEKLVLETRDL